MKTFSKALIEEINDVLNESNSQGKLIAVASRPGLGKSTFLLNELLNVTNTLDGSTLLFTLEASKNSVLDKLIKNKNCTKKCLDKIIINDYTRDIDGIEKTIKCTPNLSAVFIDYIGLVKGDKAIIPSRLKKICEENNLHIFYAMQLKRPQLQRDDQRPMLCDFDKGNRNIADIIMALYRPTFFECEEPFVQLRILKNDGGEVKDVPLIFNSESLSYDYCPDCKYDFSAKKRAELHLHTKLSNDISVIGVEEIFEKAEEYGLSAVAFTNLNNVQDFPEIMRCAKKYENIKVIYGAEVFYELKDGSCCLKLTLLAKNQEGIKELYKVISSQSNDGVCDSIDLDVLKQNRKNLLVGSCGSDGELFYQISLGKGGEELERIAAFYDYFEIFPAKDEQEKAINKKITELGEELGVLVAAVSNAHYLEAEDDLCRDIVRVAIGLESNIEENLYLRKTEEMLKEFSYLGTETAKKVVLDNPKNIADLTNCVKPLKEGYYRVEYENDFGKLKSLCYEGASKIYGAFVHESVHERLEAELELIKKHGFASDYLTVYELTKFITESGHIVGSRGMSGSSLVAFLIGISDVNPLPPHYYCADCGCFEQSDLAQDGFDLPNKPCPVCGAPLKTDGHNIPYETFMGLRGDKMPDFDINVARDAHQSAFGYLQQLFGKDRVVRAGTISTIQERVAEMMLMEYEQITDVLFLESSRQEIVKKIIGVKNCDGRHPGGVMIIPPNMEVEDFTPIRNEGGSLSVTHFDFHILHDTILKQDVLAHQIVEFIELLCKQTGVSLNEINLNDPEIYSFFNLGDTTGLGECENKFMQKVSLKTNTRSFNDLVKISGFAHGTGVWLDNGEHLINNGVELSKIPTVRDDIMNDLVNIGVDKAEAYSFCEAVRKGLIAKGRLSEEKIKRFKEVTKPLGDWYFDYCAKVQYMFPKAHAVSYVTNAVRCAWFKKYYPEHFRKAYMECLFVDEE